MPEYEEPCERTYHGMPKVISRPRLVTSPQKMIAFMGLKHTFFLLLLLLQHIVSGHNHPLPDRRHRATLQEKATLLSFKNTTITSQSQAALANWNESTDVCDFIGVSCDRWRLHVVRLLLGGMLVSGPLSPILANLSSLRELHLSNNLLTGHIPHELSNLRHLKILDLSTNSLDGQIPQSLSSLTRLEWLELSRNHLDGPIPRSLANLTRLQWLDLSNNRLTGHIPVEFSNLQQFEGLEVSENLLDGPIPQSLATISNLIYLNLFNNRLTGQIPALIFRNCNILQDMDFSVNYLTGEIPSDAQIYLPNLSILNLYLNNLTGKLPSWLSNSSSLSQLDVGYNFLSGELPSDIVWNKTCLEVLHLSYNNFSSRRINTDLRSFFLAISNCSKLTELEMAGLALVGPLPQIVGRLPKSLSTIQLGDNMIFGPIPPDIGYLVNITLLNLSSNLLNGTIPTLIGQLPKLERLILSNNFLSGAIPPEIGNIVRSIGLLDLSSNTLSGEIPRSLGNLSLISEIHLQKNQLYGEIPASLGRCIRLEKLDLSYNRLTGKIPPEISGIVKISFNLSHNHLQGPLPIELSNMDQVQEIDLSSNNLTGEVISQLSACAELKLINLSHNSLQGQLPKSFGDLRNLETLDISFNYLVGEIPLSFNKCTSLTQLNLSYNDFNGPIPVGGVFSLFTNLSYLGNPHLCGSVIGRACFERRRWLHSYKFLIAICVSASVLALLLALCCVIGIRKTQGRIFRGRDDNFGSSWPVLKSSFPRITYQELIKATGEFDQDRLIGSGSYGQVYKGVLRDGTIVAVKVLHLHTGNSTKSFNRECQVLKRIRHRNLMRIITTCSRPDFKALVLPFMANGSLENFLYSGSSELNLIQRVNICSDIAEGIAYLHHHSPVKVIHCDLKPSNVLLNDDMTALVSDFGIARLVMNVGAGNTTGADDMGSSTANMLRGSIGYIAPEYGFGSDASTRGDVYSFGVVVLEMVTRKRPTDEMFKGSGLSLPNWVKSHYTGRVGTVIDNSLLTAVKNETYEVKRMWEVGIGELVDLGLLCTQENPSSRPTMLDAADDLSRLKRYLLGDTTASFTTSLGMSSSTIGEDPGASIFNFD